MLKPELLSPAGTLKNMYYAFAYGADAVYAGQPRYSLRTRNNEFSNDILKIGIHKAHEMGKKFYIVANIAPHNAKLKTFVRDLIPVIDMKPDAIIISDPGLIMLTREHFPDMEIHLSVQANVVNWATVKFWKQMGLARIILSRELSLEEIEEIRSRITDIEIEIFVHGALCMAYSGRCLLSNYINKRDSNQGTCTNVCRWQYKVQDGTEDVVGNIIHKQKPVSSSDINSISNISLHNNSTIFVLEEAKRPGSYMTSLEDEHGTYIMNSKDLCAVSHVEKLMKLGVHALKIEGRTKSYYYCARTAQVYRKAIDDAAAGKPFDPYLVKMLEGLANRGYTEGFLCRHTKNSYQNYEHGYSISKSQQFVGSFTGKRKGNMAEVQVKNKFTKGDKLELMTPRGNFNFILKHLENKKGESITVAPGDGHIVWLPVMEDISLNFALLIRNFNGENTRNPYINK